LQEVLVTLHPAEINATPSLVYGVPSGSFSWEYIKVGRGWLFLDFRSVAAKFHHLVGALLFSNRYYGMLCVLSSMRLVVAGIIRTNDIAVFGELKHLSIAATNFG